MKKQNKESNENEKQDTKIKNNSKNTKIKNEENNNNNKENNDNINTGKELKKGFFKKVWYSIDKIEKYSELSAEGFRSAMKYAFILILIIAFFAGIATTYKNAQEVKNMAKIIEEKAPEFTYKDSKLTVDSQNVINEDDENYGKIIIDTNTEDEKTISQYVSEITNSENGGVVILKNKIIMKQTTENTAESYNYEDLAKEAGITEFNRAELINYLNGKGMYNVYTNLFLTLFVYAIIIYAFNALAYIILISLIGYITSAALRLKIRYIAIFNMAVYSITLSTILNIAYIIVNTIWNYQIAYFGVMYILIASIYMIAAIFILKMEYNKKQKEVQKIVEVQKEVENEIKEDKTKQKNPIEKEPEKKKTESKKTKDKKEKEEEQDNGIEENGGERNLG